MNLAAMSTTTTVEFQPGLQVDLVEWDGQVAAGQARDRVVAHLDRVRALAGIGARAQVCSRNDFPVGVGLASSAAAFAALSLAASAAAGLELDQPALSRLARLGSGSASRSVPAGFTLWDGEDDEASFSRQVAPPDHWALCDVVALTSHAHKSVGSDDGHALAWTSPLHTARLAAIPALLEKVRGSIERRDLQSLGETSEQDALLMHGVMMTSSPSLVYWEPSTVAVLHAVRAWRKAGLGVYFTMDAGPSVHCICHAADAREVADRLAKIPGVLKVRSSGPGGGARLLAQHLF
jgi:diphosphomevalonate decarboxylase